MPKTVELISRSSRHLQSYKLQSCVQTHKSYLPSCKSHKIFIQQLKRDKGTTSVNILMQRVTLDGLKTEKQARSFPTSYVKYSHISAVKINITVYLPVDGEREFLRN
jgi:hypothetical protein